VVLSRVIDVTEPTDTPALRTGAFFFRPPMLSKRARTVYVFVGLKLVRLAAFNARNARAMMTSKTKTPTRVSVLFFAMSDSDSYP